MARRTLTVVITATVAIVALLLVGGAALQRTSHGAGGTPRIAEIDPTPPAPSGTAPVGATPSPSAMPSRTGPRPALPSAQPGTVTDARPVNVATRLRTLPAATRQVIVVHTASVGTNTGTLEAFTKTDGVWRPAFGAMTARIGTRGFADNKVEGDLKTPTGVYPIGSTMYGIAANPGVRYSYHRLVPDDYWNENPATPGYNTFFHGPNPGGASEALWQVSPQYTYFAVINYNIPVTVANPPRGSGIFLHEARPGSATAGCVALSRSDLVKVLTWLDPAAAPRIVMAPTSALSRY